MFFIWLSPQEDAQASSPSFQAPQKLYVHAERIEIEVFSFESKDVDLHKPLVPDATSLQNEIRSLLDDPVVLITLDSSGKIVCVVKPVLSLQRYPIYRQTR